MKTEKRDKQKQNVHWVNVQEMNFLTNYKSRTHKRK